MSKRPPAPLADSATIAAARMSPADFKLDNAFINEMAVQHARRAELASTHALDAPPLVTRGERVEERLIMDNGEIKVIPARRGYGGDSAFIDWVNLTVHEETFAWEGSNVVADDQLIIQASLDLMNIFGFGIVSQREKGANFYKRSYVLGDNYGKVCHGGQRNTVMVSLTGEGCAAAKDGWEKRLYDWLNKAVSPKLTRIDTAHDVYDGVKYSVDQAFQEYAAGLYSCGGRTPDCEQRGNWFKPNGKGRTLNIGHRTNGKFGRIYEKGRQLGSSVSEWVRCEVEFKSVDREIPFEILLRPGEFLAASYPALAWISERAERIKTIKNTAEISYSKMVEFVKRQCGAAIWSIAQIEGSLEAAYSVMVRAGEVPARLKIPAFDSVIDFIHDRKRECVPDEVLIERAFSGL